MKKYWTPGRQSAAAGDWRRGYGDEMAGFLRDYALDLGDAGRLFDSVRRPAAEVVLRPPHSDPEAAWALATLAALLSGDWLNAREPVPGSGPVPDREVPDPVVPDDDAGRVTR